VAHDGHREAGLAQQPQPDRAREEPVRLALVDDSHVASLVARKDGHRSLGRVLSGVAYAGTLFSAHLGGHLSFGLGVRVNRTAFESPRDRYAPVCDESDLNGGKLVGVELESESVVVSRSEESGDAPSRLAAKRLWIVDPIDGTRAFLRGLADWSIAAALVDDGRPVLGVIFAPAEGALFSAGDYVQAQRVRSIVRT